MINLKFGMAGKYRLEKGKVDSDGEPIESTAVPVTEWFDNLLTDRGMDQFRSVPNPLTGCSVGAGNSTPSFGDTALQSQIAWSSARTIINRGCQNQEQPFYGFVEVRYRFNQGLAKGNLSEVGVGPNAANLTSRTLIRDSSGNPTAITVLEDEFLDVYYEFRVYAPSQSEPYVIVDSETLTEHTCITAPASLANGSWNVGIWDVRLLGESASSSYFGRIEYAAYSGNFYSPVGLVEVTTPIFASRGGFSEAAPTPSTITTMADYVPGSFTVSGVTHFPLNRVNHANGIAVLAMAFGACGFQTCFNPPIPKTSNELLNVGFTLSWFRYDE